MESRDVFTQDELEEVLGQPELIPICAGEGEFTVGEDQFARAADAARVFADGDASIEAGGSATIVARGRARVMARNSVSVDADDSVFVSAGNDVFVRACGQSRVVAAGSASVDATGEAFVVAQARAAVRAADRARVRALLSARVNLKGDARAWVWGLSSTMASERAVVIAWGSATVFATDSASVEALEAAVVIAGGSATVRAFGSVMVRARGQARVEASDGVAILRHGPRGAVSGGGATAVVLPKTGEEWCRYYGVPVEQETALLYKAVDDNFDSYHGTSYRPGSAPQAPDWDEGERECGGGLHFAPRPTFALPAPQDVMRFVACPVRVEDIVVHPSGVYRDKVKARGVCAPVYEVYEDGTPVAEGAALRG